jgi:hypothetical protein
MLPLVTVHGGPAFTHNYLLPLRQQACLGRTVVLYDQVSKNNEAKPGCLHSILSINLFDLLGWVRCIVQQHHERVSDGPVAADR